MRLKVTSLAQLLLPEFVKPGIVGASTYRASSGFVVTRDKSGGKEKERKKEKKKEKERKKKERKKGRKEERSILLTSYSAVPKFMCLQYRKESTFC